MIVDKRDIILKVIQGKMTKEQARSIKHYKGTTVAELFASIESDETFLVDIPSLTFPEVWMLDDMHRGTFKDLSKYFLNT